MTHGLIMTPTLDDEVAEVCVVTEITADSEVIDTVTHNYTYVAETCTLNTYYDTGAAEGATISA